MAKEWWEDAPLAEESTSDAGDWWKDAPLESEPVKKSRTFGDAAGDGFKSFGASVNNTLKTLTDLAGANNPASEFLEENAKTWQDDYSPEYKAELRKQAGEKAALGDDPSYAARAGLMARQTIRNPIEGVGELAGNIAPMMVGGLAGMGTKGIAALSAAMGAGAVKGGIAETVQNTPDADLMPDPLYAEMRQGGLSEKDAKAQLSEQRASYGDAYGKILLGAGVGAAVGRFGSVENAIANIGKKAAAQAPVGLLKGVSTGVAKEVATEIPQEMAETYLGNKGASAKGANIASDQGVIEAGVKAGILSAVGGGLAGASGRGGSLDEAPPTAETAPDPITPPASILSADTTDEAITEFIGENSKPAGLMGAIDAGRQFQELGITAPADDLAMQRIQSERDGAAASQARDQRLKDAGQAWQDLGVTNPSDDLQAQRMGLRESKDVSANPDLQSVPASSTGRGNTEPGIGLETALGRDSESARSMGAGLPESVPPGESVAPADRGNADAVEPTKTWFGRKGDGYATEGDAVMALPSRQKIEPDLNWQVEQMPSGKFRLAGYADAVVKSDDETPQAQAQQATPEPVSVRPGAESQIGGSVGRESDVSAVDGQQAEASSVDAGMGVSKGVGNERATGSNVSTAFDFTRNATGTLTVYGDPAAIRAAGINGVVKFDAGKPAGILVSVNNAPAVSAQLEAARVQNNPANPANIEAAPVEARAEAPKVDGSAPGQAAQPAAGSGAVQTVAQKQPWEMSRKEWEAERDKIRPDTVQSNLTRASGSQAAGRAQALQDILYGVTDEASSRLKAAQKGDIELSETELEDITNRLNTRVSHSDVIAKAIAEGRPVPQEVLAEYPDLQPQGTANAQAPEAIEAKPSTTTQAAADRRLTPVSQRAQEVDVNSVGHKLPKGARVGNGQDIAAMFSTVENKSPAKKDSIRYAVVGDADAQGLKKETGLDLAGYRHAVDNFALRHTVKTHGTEGTETMRGQMPVTADDVAKIPEIVRAYDSVSLVGKDSIGRDLLQYRKRYNGTTYYVEEVRDGRMELSAKTLWKTRTTPHAAPEGGVAQTSETISSNSPQRIESIANLPNKGAEVSRYTGKYGKGMGHDAAKLEASRLNRANKDASITYTAEEHNDPKLENPWAVVGRKTEPAAQKEPAADAMAVPSDAQTQSADAAVDDFQSALDQEHEHGVSTGNKFVVRSKQDLEEDYGPLADSQVDELNEAYQHGVTVSDEIEGKETAESLSNDESKANEADPIAAAEKPASAMTASELLRAAADKMDAEKPATKAEQPESEYTVDAPRRKYQSDKQGDLFNAQLDIFLNSQPDASQAGPAVEVSRRDAVAAVQDLHATGTILAQALSSDYAARQRTSLVGQKIASNEDLAVLAQLYRDPRFETFRVIFTDAQDKAVAQIGLTSRLPGSTSAIIGNDINSYLSDLSRTAQQQGATGYFLLHNHPSGLPTPSRADQALTKEFDERMPALDFKGHVVIDTNQYAVIDGAGDYETFDKDFGQAEPMTSSQWGGLKFSNPAHVMGVARQMQVDTDAVTLIVTDHQYKVKGVATVPHAAITGDGAANKMLLVKSALIGRGSQLFAVGRDRAKLISIGASVRDAIHVDVNGGVSSLAESGLIRGGEPFPRDRRIRLSADTSPEFGYLRPFTKQQTQGLKVAESRSVITGQSLSNITQTIKEATAPIGTVSLWDKTVGTKYHLATKDADFKRVFDGYTQQTDDTAHYAIESERHAPDILMRLESLGDIWSGLMHSGAKHKANVEAVSKALFANIEGKKGIQQFVFDDLTLKQVYKLAPKQIEMYRQARKAVDTSIERLAQTFAAQMGADQGMDISSVKNFSLEDTVEMVKMHIKDAHDELRSMVKMSADVEGAKEVKAPTKEETAELLQRLSDMQKHAEFLQETGYMPAMRFGEFAVTVTQDGETLHFEMFESKTAANLAAMKLKKDYPDAEIAKSVLNPQQYAMFKGVSPETVELFARFTGMDQNEAYQDYIALAKSARSVKVRELQRKGTAGFSEDATRVMASFITSNARQSAVNMNSKEITEAMASKSLAKKGDVQREAQKLHEYMANPLEEARRIRGFMFMHFMGGSIASAAVNLTQPVLQTTPYLHQFAGAKVAGIMAKSAKMAVTGKIDNKELADAVKRAAEDGITEPHEIHQLMADASNTSLGSSLKARAAIKAWGSFFALTEAYNRRLTFIAAYQTAQETKVKDAYEFARKAVIETQGLYAKQNRPNWARGAVGATLFTFKQFSIAYVEFLARLPTKQKALALTLLVLAAGLQGLPGADDLEDLIDTIGQSMGYNTNSKKALRKQLLAVFGEDLGEILDSGIFTKSAVDVQGRLGMGNLLPATAIFKPSETDKSRTMSELAGPLGGILTAFQNAVGKVQRGDYGGSVMEMSPVAIKNLAKGIDMMASGVYKDTRGRKVADVDALDSFVKMLGLQPSSIAKSTRILSDELQDKGMVNTMESMIADRWAQGVHEKDYKQVMEARRTLIAWNENNPLTPIKITPAQIQSRVKQMNLTRVQRYLKTTPKELRANSAKELAQ